MKVIVLKRNFSSTDNHFYFCNQEYSLTINELVLIEEDDIREEKSGIHLTPIDPNTFSNLLIFRYKDRLFVFPKDNPCKDFLIKDPSWIDNVIDNLIRNKSDFLRTVERYFITDNYFIRGNHKYKILEKDIKEEPVFIISKSISKIDNKGVSHLQDYKSNKFPHIFMYKSNLYGVIKDSRFTIDEMKLMIKAYDYKHTEKIKNIQKEVELYESLNNSLNPPREPIPVKVRFFVWRRDEGKCVQCGSNKDLEFDHIIPLSKGGSNTERNLQLLCGKCNRKKSSRI